MIKLVALYRRPEDPEEFDRHFLGTHIPLLRQFPGVRSVDVLRIDGAPIGESTYRYLVEAVFESRDSMDAAFASREGKAVARDIMMFAAGLVTVFHGTPVD